MELEQVYVLLKYLFLGLFQGFTEPIPISSSGHLLLAQHFLGVELEGGEGGAFTFELLVNSASLIAVLLIYKEDIMRLTVRGLGYIKTKDPADKKEFDFIIYLLIGTIPAGVIGVLLGDYIAEASVSIVAGTLMITGIALFMIRNLRGNRGEGGMTVKDAIIIGLAQAVALIPGISRSGATIVAAMARGIHQETALRYSFLLFIPVSLGGMILSVSDLLSNDAFADLWIPYLLAFAGSLVASYFSLKWFMNIMAKGNLIYFAVYCIVVGPIIFLVLFLQ
ncbi:undecaprenyl-diphosphate phosphatase [Jeotgalibacillus campisalis]|uniref:Undecaprenyl-diphosphatase n=1 Tax=Jeotgalibacillus campisalis TaxID=220754 RepID=A0A0C2VSI4_9BACL|nr:undecaprenyl-diphosphate phosphatase [Jeotgalibacillus campisalis]KIL47391.1 UDP pyrophosphate phosphatase [Jeotgalibacillus campisalis]